MIQPGERRATTVLTAHCVRSPLLAPHDVSPGAFSEVVARVVATSDVVTDLGPVAYGAVSGAHDGTALGARPRVMFTFDDATIDHVDVARELSSHGVAGVFYVPTDRVGTPGYADWAQLRELADAGHVIGSHSVRHLPLATLSRADVRRELVDSRAELQDRMQQPIDSFAPPGGIITPYLHEEMQHAGYAMCRLTAWGVFRTGDDELNVPSVPITEFTVRRGWVTAALDKQALPVAMRISFGVRAMIPETLRKRIRAVLR